MEIDGRTAAARPWIGHDAARRTRPLPNGLAARRLVAPAREPVEPAPSRFHLPITCGIEPGEDLVAIGADLAPGTLLAGFRNGIFPLPCSPHVANSKLAWYSPDPRGVISLDTGPRISRSLRRSIRRYEVRIDTDVDAVLDGCADPQRPGFWITADFKRAYTTLFDLGWARTISVVHDGRIVGGLFGVRIDRYFVGLSMFHRETDASKVGLVHLVDWLRTSGCTLLDVQWPVPHLRSLGAIEIDRERFLRELVDAID